MLKASMLIPPEIADHIPAGILSRTIMFEIVFIENEEKNIGSVRTGDYCLACNDISAYDIIFPKICGVMRYIGKTIDSWIPNRALHYFRAIEGIPAEHRPSAYPEKSKWPETIPEAAADINQLSWQEVVE